MGLQYMNLGGGGETHSPTGVLTDFDVEWPSGLFLEKLSMTVSLGLSSRVG